MATGFPTKANWVSGDILTATQMDDLAGTVNLLSNASATTGSQLVSNAAGTSFAYQPTPSASNPVLNSAFNVWQRYTTQVTGTITAATSGATTAYVVANSFVVGQYVTVTGMTPTTLNGAGVVTVASGVGFTISASTSGTFSAGGIATGSPYTASTVAAGDYNADRWQIGFSQTGKTVSRQPTNDTTNLPSIQYCARVQKNAGQTFITALQFVQSFESINSIPFAGKSVTFSFYARVGANFSGTSNQIIAQLISGTGTDQNYLGTYTGANAFISQSTTLTTTWQRFSYQGTVPTTATELAIQFFYNPVGTAGANDYFEITGIQIDVGSVALPFRTYGATYQAELAACQRYYYQPTAGAYWNGYATSGVNFYVMVYLPVAMRTSPTITNTSIAAGNFPATASSPTSAGTTSFANTRTATATGAGGFADTYTASAEL